jgi:hypothetical protein
MGLRFDHSVARSAGRAEARSPGGGFPWLIWKAGEPGGWDLVDREVLAFRDHRFGTQAAGSGVLDPALRRTPAPAGVRPVG